jgi:hypothetical protein
MVFRDQGPRKRKYILRRNSECWKFVYDENSYGVENYGTESRTPPGVPRTSAVDLLLNLNRGGGGTLE